MANSDAVSDNLSQAEARDRAAAIRDCSYDIDLQLSDDPTASSFRSAVTLRFHAEAGGSTFVDLDAESVESVVLNGRSLGNSLTDGRIALSGLAGGANTLEVVARCRYGDNGVGLHRLIEDDGSVYLYTNCEPFDAHRWFACFDQPDLKGEFQLSVTGPAGWKYYANYPQESSTPGDDPAQRTIRHTRTPKLSTYLIALVAGPYHEWTDSYTSDDGVVPAQQIPLSLSCRESLAPYLDAAAIFEVTKAGFGLYRRVFQRAYPFSQYAQVWCPDFNVGAMENAGCVTFNDEAYTPRSRKTDAWYRNRANTILHEMAHMWFGDLVTMRWWDDLWLNESFATFMAYYCLTKATRWTDAWVDFANSEKTWAARQDQLPSTHPVAISGDQAADIARVFLNFDGITYAKGASVLRALVAYVSEDSFFEGLGTYFSAHQWSNATFADFLAALEQSSGKPLGAWADAWLRTTGMSTLRAETADAGGRYTSVVLSQQPAPGSSVLRPHRVGVALYARRAGSLVQTKRVEVDLTEERLALNELVGEPVADLVLLNDGDLTFAKVRFDERSVATMVSDLGSIADPLARTLCWSAVWDLARDAELPAQTFVEMVATHSPREDQVGVLQRLLQQARSTIELYVRTDARESARRQLCAVARRGLAGADPASDEQLAWAHTYIATAGEPADLDRLRALYDGEEVIDGLNVDVDLRWSIVDRLAITGRADEQLISGQLRAAGDSMDQLHAESTRASRPDPAVKAEVWRRLTTPGEKLQLLNAMVGGFRQPEQQALLEPYVERFEEAVAGFWNRSKEEAAALTTGLYPAFIVDDRVVAMADRLLASEELPEPARRIVAEQRDGTLRAQRAQRADRSPAPAPSRVA
ncbi:MAG: aminopeptidase N [Candidatus Dormibacteria bacterium]